MSKIFPRADKSSADLKALHDAAAAAVEALNHALRFAAPNAVRGAGLAFGYQMVAPESPAPIPVMAGKLVPRDTRPGPTRQEMVTTARRLGMSESLIAERFGPGFEKPERKPTSKVPVQPVQRISIADLFPKAG